MLLFLPTWMTMYHFLLNFACTIDIASSIFLQLSNVIYFTLYLQFLQRVFTIDTMVKPLPPVMAYNVSRNLNFFTRIFTQFFGMLDLVHLFTLLEFAYNIIYKAKMFQSSHYFKDYYSVLLLKSNSKAQIHRIRSMNSSYIVRTLNSGLYFKMRPSPDIVLHLTQQFSCTKIIARLNNFARVWMWHPQQSTCLFIVLQVKYIWQSAFWTEILAETKTYSTNSSSHVPPSPFD